MNGRFLISFFYLFIFYLKINKISIFGRFIYGKLLLENSPEEGFTLLMDVAEEGYPPALYLIYQCFLNGVGAEKSNKDALHWLEKCAETGLADALFDLALVNLGHTDLPLVSKNPQEAKETIVELSENGYENAIEFLKENKL